MRLVYFTTLKLNIVQVPKSIAAVPPLEPDLCDGNLYLEPDHRPLDCRHLDCRPLDCRHLERRPLTCRHLEGRPLDCRHLERRGSSLVSASDCGLDWASPQAVQEMK